MTHDKRDPRAGGREKIDRRLFRLLLPNLLLGAASGWAFVGALIMFNIGGMGALIARSGDPALAVAMLLAVMTITWGSAAMGTAVFLLPFGEDEDGAKERRAAPVCYLLKPARAPRR